MDNEDEYEIDPITGQMVKKPKELTPVEPAPIVYKVGGGNPNTYSKGEVDARIAAQIAAIPSSGGGGGAPTGPAGGDLTGTYPNPTVSGTANVATIIQSYIPSSSPPNGTAGGDLTGTYPNPTVSGTVNVQNIVRGNRLDQFQPPAVNISLNSKKITNLANGSASDDAAAFGQIPTALPPNGSASGDLTGSYPAPTIKSNVNLPGNPTTTTQAVGDNSTKIATTSYVDSSINDFDIKLAARAASQANLNFTRSGNIYTAGVLGVLLKATIDSGWSTGAVLAVGDRILLANQTSAVDNGIVTITNLGTIGTNATLQRSTDMDADAEITSEMRVPITEGTDANIDYKLSSAGPFTLNTTALPFTKAGGPPTGTAGGDLTGTYPNPTVSGTANVATIINNYIATQPLPANNILIGQPNGVAGSKPLSGDASVTASGIITAPALGNVVKYGSLTVVGHSYTAGTTQTDSGTSNVYQESNVAKLQSLFGIHENNVIHLGQAGERITSSVNPILADAWAGWSGAWKFITPNNYANANAASDTVISDPVVAVNGANIIVHGVNDFAIDTTGTAAVDTQAILNSNNAMKNAYRSIMSRMRSGYLAACTVASGVLTWDSTLGFSGGSDVVATTQNTGPGYKSFTTNGNTFTITIPTNFTGGVIAINLIGQANGVTTLTGNYAASGAITVAVTANTDFASSGTLVIKNANTGEEMLVTAGLGSNSWTVTSGNRGANGTAAAAGTTADIICVATDAHKVTWTTSATAGAGLFTTATGSTSLSGQGMGNQVVSVTKRFTAIAADAGKTITGTIGGIVTGDTSAKVIFDSWQIESGNPPPIVIANLAHWSYGATLNRNELLVAGWNTSLSTVVAEFDSWVQIADVYTPSFNRNGTISVAVPASGESGTSTSVTTTSLTDTTKGWAVNALVGNTITTNGKTMVVTSNTATVLTGTSWTGGTPSVTTYTVNGTAASVAWTANSTLFTPTIGMRFSFGRLGGEHVDITAVSGSYPNWILGVKRAVGGTSAAAHSLNNFLGPLQWFHSDDIHLTAQGHAVFAEIMYRAFVAMPTPNTYQVAENQGNWSQGSQSFSMGVLDNGWIMPSINTTAAGTVTQNKQTAIPIYISKTSVVVGMAVTPRASSTGIIRYGLYLPDASHSRPGRLLIDFGASAYISTATWATTGFEQLVRPGYYWLSAVQQSVAVSMNVVANGGLSWPIIATTTTPTGNTSTNINGYFQTGISGTLADWGSYSETSTGASGSLVIAIQLRAKNFS